MKKRFSNPFILFVPFLLLDIILVFKFKNLAYAADGPRYIYYAQNLIHGFFSPPPPDINLWNGPGYPIVLIPFVWLKLPVICITLLNAFFHYASMVMLFKTLRRITTLPRTIFFSLLWAVYLVAYEQIPYVATEPFAFLLCTLIAFWLVKSVQENNTRAAVLCGLFLGWLTLVKVIFGYVLLLLMLIYAVTYLVRRSEPFYRRILITLLVAFATVLPWLTYTYHLTGKIFYWGNSGGTTLYWMSTPYKHEFGDWQPNDLNTLLHPPADSHPFKGKDTTAIQFQAFQELVNNHRDDYAEFDTKTGVAKDDAFKEKAVANIKKHPGKFFYNCFANLGRLLFNVPYTWKFQDPTMLVRIMINAVVFTFILISSLITMLKWKQMDKTIRFLLLLLGLYLGASIVVSTYVRMFYIAVPVVIIWMAYLADRFVQIKFPKEVNRHSI